MPNSLTLPMGVAIEQGIALWMRLDPDSRDRIDSLDGKTIRLAVTTPSLDLVLSVADGKVDVMTSYDGDVDTTITGSLQALRSLQDDSAALYRKQVQIEGDLATGQALKSLLSKADVDVEELIAPLTGDFVAHRLGATARLFSGWVERNRRRFREDSGEWLTEEIQVVAPTSEVRHFCDEVDEVKAGSDRIAARLEHLERTMDVSKA